MFAAFRFGFSSSASAISSHARGGNRQDVSVAMSLHARSDGDRRYVSILWVGASVQFSPAQSRFLLP